jgi:hypothetical protein
MTPFPAATSGGASLDQDFAALMPTGAQSSSVQPQSPAGPLASSPGLNLGSPYDIDREFAQLRGWVSGSASVDATQGNTFAQNALIGSGKAFTDLGLGAQQMAADIANSISPQRFSAWKQSLQQQAADKRVIDAPIMKTGGGKVGDIGTGVLTALPLAAVPGANTYLGVSAIGAGLGALSPTTAQDSRLLNTGLGAALGAGGKVVGDKVGGWLASRLPQPPPALAGAQAQAAQQGQSLGMRLTPGQMTGSGPLQQVESKLESQPWTSGPFAALKGANQKVLNRATAQSIGEDTDKLDSTVLDAANERLGNVFQNARSSKTVLSVDPKQTSSVLDAIDSDARGLLPGNGSIRDNPLVSDLEGLTGQGTVNGQQLGSLSSKLGKAAYKQMTSPSGDRDWGDALYAVKGHVDDLLGQTLSPKDAAEYAAARQQYRNLMLLTSRTNIVNPSTGDVSGAALAGKLQQADRSGYLYGRNQTPMYQAARFAQAFKPMVGNSGTATRSVNFTDLAQLPLGLPMNIASRMYLSGIGRTAVPGTMGGANVLANAARAAGRVTGQGLQAVPPGLGGLMGPYLTQQ